MVVDLFIDLLRSVMTGIFKASEKHKEKTTKTSWRAGLIDRSDRKSRDSLLPAWEKSGNETKQKANKSDSAPLLTSIKT